MHDPLRRNSTTGLLKQGRQPPTTGHQISSLRTMSPEGGGRKHTGEETAGAVKSPTTMTATGRLKVPKVTLPVTSPRG
ncbi:hypothetical protein LINPERPRIM_LOCUS20583 [Linum perenne]